MNMSMTNDRGYTRLGMMTARNKRQQDNEGATGVGNGALRERLW